MVTLVGYHGTTREFANNILNTQKFKMSKKDTEWLGKGVYFFENDIMQAYYFCRKARNYEEWAIIKSMIKAEVVLDLIDTKTYQYVKQIAKTIKDRELDLNNGKKRKLKNAVILNYIYKLKPYDVVRGIFMVPHTYNISETNIFQYQIQLCVRNLDCIKTIEEVEYNEY